MRAGLLLFLLLDGAQPLLQPSAALARPRSTALRAKPTAFWCLRDADNGAAADCVIELEADEEDMRVFALGGCGGVPAATVSCRQISFGLGKTGGQVWPAAIALAAHLASPSMRADMAGLRVGELGAGCGLPGLVLGALGDASEVVLTDCGVQDGAEVNSGDRLLPHGVMDNLRANSAANDNACRVAELDWWEHSAGEPVSPSEQYDVLVGSDLTYYEEDIAPLVGTLRSLLKPMGRAHLMLPAATRRKVVPQMLDAIREVGTVTVTPKRIVNWDPDDEVLLVEFVNDKPR